MVVRSRSFERVQESADAKEREGKNGWIQPNWWRQHSSYSGEFRIAGQRHAGMFHVIYARMEMDRGVAEAGAGGV